MPNRKRLRRPVRQRRGHRRTRRGEARGGDLPLSVNSSDDQADDDSLPAEAEVEQEDVEHLKFHIGKNLTRRIDQYLTDRVSYLSRNGVQRCIDDGLVKVNGRVVKASYRPRAGDEIEMVAPPE